MPLTPEQQARIDSTNKHLGNTVPSKADPDLSKYNAAPDYDSSASNYDENGNLKESRKGIAAGLANQRK